MLMFDETTLDRAAAVFGPHKVERRFLQDYARLNRAAGELAVRLVDLLESRPVNEYLVTDALTKTSVALINLYLALEQLQALFGYHPGGTANTFVSVHTLKMNELEKSVREEEQARARKYGMPSAKPGACLYDKHEILEMVCAMAAAEKEKEETNGKSV